MSEFTIHSDSIDVEQIMDQIRARVQEKRGEDYTEAQIREMAGVKLERFLDPDKVRSDLVDHYRRTKKEQPSLVFPKALRKPPPAPEGFEFDPDIIYRSSRGITGSLLYGIRKILSPLLKFFINVGPIVHALHVQREINERQNEAINWMVQTQTEFIDRLTKLLEKSSSRLASREEIDALNYEVMNNLVVEMTRLSIEMKNHRMRVESVAGRLDFNERRAKALEGVVQYRNEQQTLGDSKADGTKTEEAEPKRRRRRRGRRRPTRTEATALKSENQPTRTTGTDSSKQPIPPGSSDQSAPKEAKTERRPEPNETAVVGSENQPSSITGNDSAEQPTHANNSGQPEAESERPSGKTDSQKQ